MSTSRRGLMGLAAAGAAILPAFALAQEPPRSGGRRGGGRGGSAAQAAPPLARDEAEKRALAVLDDIDQRQRYLNIARDDGRLLRVLAQSIGAKRAIEVGTSTGYSAIWLALGLRANGGSLVTYEIDKARAGQAQGNFRKAGLDGVIEVVVGDAHAEVPKAQGPLDLVFIDADKEGYLDYLNAVLPKLRGGGLVIADNMQMPAPDPLYVQAVTTDPGLETLFLNMHATGLGVTLKKG